jgi:hypothetical protein
VWGEPGCGGPGSRPALPHTRRGAAPGWAGSMAHPGVSAEAGDLPFPTENVTVECGWRIMAF